MSEEQIEEALNGQREGKKEEQSAKSEKERRAHPLVFRYRHIRHTITFYDPPKGLCENDNNWNVMLDATSEALYSAFGEVAKHLQGLSLYVHGPVVPLSVIIKKPKKYCKSNGILDLIIDDECPYLTDLQIEPNNDIQKTKKSVGVVLDSIQLGDWKGRFENEKVDYKGLLKCDEDDLKRMGIPLGPRKKLLNKIQRLVAKEEHEKNNPNKWSWEDCQIRLSIPKRLPMKKVESIPLTRLQQVKYQEDFGDYLVKYLRYFGYAFVKLPEDMMIRLNKYKQMWNEFFDRSDEEKDKCTLDKVMHGGFGGYYDEKDRQMFHVAPMMLGCCPPWPPGEPEFQKNAVDMFRMLETVAKTCLTSVARTIGIDPQLLLSVCEDEFHPRLLGSSCRVCRYKKQEKNSGIICMEHTDTTILSIGPVSTVPELQFYDKVKGEWIYVEDQVDDTHVVVFPGRILARMTAGYFQAAYHRVFRKSNEERLSLPFFLRPRDGAVFEIDKILSQSKLRWTRSEFIAPQETVRQDPAIYDQY